jgi:hypothetical protein
MFSEYDIEMLFLVQVAPKLKDKTDEKGGVSSNKHGAPPSTVSDNIVKEMATLKKQAAESDKRLVYIIYFTCFYLCNGIKFVIPIKFSTLKLPSVLIMIILLMNDSMLVWMLILPFLPFMKISHFCRKLKL